MDPLEALRWLQSLDPLLGYLILFLGATVEYLFPPFPGDTITLAGAVMVGGAGWSAPAVLAVTTLGSVLGAWIDYEVGRWLQTAERDTWLHRRLRAPAVADRIRSITDRFARYGPAFILANRFLPAVRGVFFVAAGMAGLRRATVLFYAALSALAWNALILALGAALGLNLDALITLFQRYTTAAWIGLALIAAAWLITRLIQRRKPPPAP